MFATRYFVEAAYLSNETNPLKGWVAIADAIVEDPGTLVILLSVTNTFSAFTKYPLGRRCIASLSLYPKNCTSVISGILKD